MTKQDRFTVTLLLAIMVALAFLMVVYTSPGPKNWVTSTIEKINAPTRVPTATVMPTVTQVVHQPLLPKATATSTPAPKPLATKVCNGFLISYFNEYGNMWSDFTCYGSVISFGIPDHASYEINLDAKTASDGIACNGVADDTMLCLIADHPYGRTIMISIKPK